MEAIKNEGRGCFELINAVNRRSLNETSFWRSNACKLGSIPRWSPRSQETFTVDGNNYPCRRFTR